MTLSSVTKMVGLVEYALIIAVIAIAIIIAMISFVDSSRTSSATSATTDVSRLRVANERPGKPGRSFHEGGCRWSPCDG